VTAPGRQAKALTALATNVNPAPARARAISHQPSPRSTCPVPGHDSAGGVTDGAGGNEVGHHSRRSRLPDLIDLVAGRRG